MRALVVFYTIFFIALSVTGASFASVDVAPSGLRQAFDAAWLRTAPLALRDAKFDEMVAAQQAAGSWLAGSPVLGLAQRSDRWTDNRGERETELTLSAPLWMPGQKSARQHVAQTGADQFAAETSQAKLAVAGEVRERLWAVALAQEALAEAEQHHHHLSLLMQDVTRRVEAGDLARTDRLLASQEALKAQSEIYAAQAKLQEAHTRYTALTSLREILAPEPEALANLSIEQHPKLQAAKKSLERAQANSRMVAGNRSDPPIVGVSMRREQEIAGAGNSRSFGVALQIPIGTAARNRPLNTAALTQVEAASTALTQIATTLQAEIDVASQQLRVAILASESASAQAALLVEHTELLNKAFGLGERGLPELLRAQSALHEANVAVRQKRIAVGLAHARLNQAIGAFP